MRLRTTTDIDTDDASATVGQIQDSLSETDYRLSVTNGSVRLYASMDTDATTVDADSATMINELNAVDGVAVVTEDLEVGDPYIRMLEEIRQHGASDADEDLSQLVENAIHDGYQQVE